MIVEQTYIKLEDPEQDVDIMYSYPAVLRDNIDDDAALHQNIEEIYEKCKTEQQVVINYQGYDIETDTNRCVKIAQPIMIGGKFKGAIVWESDLQKIIRDLVIPKSLLDRNYRYMQIRMPEYPAYKNNAFPEKNQKYSDTKNQEMLTKKQSKRFKVNDFDLNFPVGEIIFQSNYDDNLDDINENPLFVKFVNEIQEMTFTAKSKDKIAEHTEDYSYAEGHTYRFFAQPITLENLPATPDEQRLGTDYNMIVFLIAEKELGESVYTDIMEHFIRQYIWEFKWYIIGLVFALTLYITICILFLIKQSLITPITKLTDHINNTEKNQTKRELFQAKILAKVVEDRKKLLRTLKGNREAVTEEFLAKKQRQINEVDELFKLYSVFFKQSQSLVNVNSLQPELNGRPGSINAHLCMHHQKQQE